MDKEKRKQQQRKAAKKQYYLHKPEKLKKAKEWAKAHPERVKEYKKKWRLKNPCSITHWRHKKKGVPIKKLVFTGRFLVKNFPAEEGHRNCSCRGCEQSKVEYLTKYGVCKK